MEIGLLGVALGLLLAISSPKSLGAPERPKSGFPFSQAAKASLACARLLLPEVFPSETGRNVRLRSPGFDGMRVSFLGEGRRAGRVYRLTPEDPTLEPIISKLFFAAEDRVNDLKGFEFWRKELAGIDGVRVVRVLGIESNRTAYLENVDGQTLQAAWNDAKIDIAGRRLLEQRLRQLIRVAKKAIQRQGVIINERPDSVSGRIWDRDDQKFDVMIKPENIIVDSKTLELVVIDPY